jgi:hypothetical protein
MGVQSEEKLSIEVISDEVEVIGGRTKRDGMPD